MTKNPLPLQSMYWTACKLVKQTINEDWCIHTLLTKNECAQAHQTRLHWIRTCWCLSSLVILSWNPWSTPVGVTIEVNWRNISLDHILGIFLLWGHFHFRRRWLLTKQFALYYQKSMKRFYSGDLLNKLGIWVKKRWVMLMQWGCLIPRKAFKLHNIWLGSALQTI